MRLGISGLGLTQGGLLGLLPDPSTIITSTDQFAWWQAGETQAYSDLGTTPVDADGSSVRSYEPGAGSLSNFNRTTASGQEPTLQTRDGIRVVRFDGVNDYLDRPLGWDGDKTVMIVGYNPGGAQQLIFQSTNGVSSQRQHLTITASDTATIYAQAVGGLISEPFPVPGGFYSIIVEFAGDRTTLAINGYGKQFSKNPGPNTIAGGFRAGRSNSGSTYAAHDEVAAVVVNDILTATEHRQLMKWGCRIAGIPLPVAPRSTDNYAVDISRVRTVTAYEVGYAEVPVPSYEPTVVDVQNETEFDGVVNAAGERLNYLVVSGRDHNLSGTGFGDGIYMTCVFGDPLDGTWKRYDQALADGDLANFTGTKPAATNGMIFLTGTENETPALIKVGSTWNLLSQIQNVNGSGNQGTVQAQASSPFGPYTLVGTSGVDDAFLDPVDASGNHTGYARILETPADSTITEPYVVRSLAQGGGVGDFALWTVDASFSRASVALVTTQLKWAPTGLTAPTDGVSPGAQVKLALDGYRGPLRYNGSTFTVLSEGVTDGFGIDPRAAMVYETRVAVDLEDYDRTYFPDLLLKASDFAPFFPHNLNGVNLPQIVDRPGGGKVLFVYGQGSVAREDYLFVMPATETP